MIFNTKTRLAVICIASAMIAVPVFAESAEQQTQNFENIPNNLIYEGRMLSSEGKKLQGEYVARFSFWNNSDYTASAVLDSGLLNPNALGFSTWQEVLPLNFNDLGHFSVVLGETKDFSTLHFASFKYLQVEIKKASEADTAYELIDINGDNGADTNDRKLIASVPYAIHSYTSKNAEIAELSQGGKDNIFILDKNNFAGNAENNAENITLQFGNNLDEALNKNISYDLDTQKFNFDTSLNVAGDIVSTGLVNGVNLPELEEKVVEQEALQNSAGFIIDPKSEHTDENLVLQFGGALAKTLTWDIAEERFALSDNLFIAGNLDLSGLVDGVDVSNLKDTVTQAQADIIKNAGDILANANDVADLKTKLTQAEQKIVDNAEAIVRNTDKITQAQADIITNAGKILENKNLITTAQADILENTANIKTNADNIIENAGDILANANDVADLKTKLTQAEQKIVDNAEAIVKNTDKITQAQADIITNAGKILENKNLITTAQADILENTANIKTNADNIASNTLNIVENAEKITNLENRTLVAESKISKNIDDIKENIQNVAAHEEAINTLKEELATLRTRVNDDEANFAENGGGGNYDDEIENVENKISDLNTEISRIKSDIDDLEDDVEINAGKIVANANAINSLDNRLTTAEQDVVTNAENILKNADDITKAKDDIIQNATNILANKNLLTQAQQDIVNNASDIDTLKTKVENLEGRMDDAEGRLTATENAINTNTSKLTDHEEKIVKNAQDILDNKNDITDLEQKIIDNAAEILKNKNAINTVSDATQQNATDIESLKDDISNISLTQYIIQQVAVGTGVISLDGTNNKINVYASRETGVENARHFYKIFSKRRTLQDVDLQFKVLLPKSFASFEKYEFSYKTDGTVDDSKFDVELKDASGNVAFASQNISKNAWGHISETNFEQDFNPQAGEYVYITFKAYSKDKNEVKIGDINIQFKTQ